MGEGETMVTGETKGFPRGAIELRGIELSACKPADDGSGDVVVRGFNAGRVSVDAELVLRGLAVESVERCSLDERPVGVAVAGDAVASDAVAGDEAPRGVVAGSFATGAPPVRARARVLAGEILSWRIVVPR